MSATLAEEVRVLTSLGYMPPRREWTFGDVAAIPRPPQRLRTRYANAMKSKARALREAVGLSLREVAKDLDYDKGAMSRLETGQRGWSLRMALSWLDYMGLAVARARREGLPLQDDAIPTLRELALGGPEDERMRRDRRKGGKRARGKVRARPRV